MFTTRQEYIIWRDAWRKNYATLSESIRNNKHNIANAYRSGTNAQPYLSALFRERHMATQMLELREQSKKMAQEQYLSQQSKTEAA